MPYFIERRTGSDTEQVHEAINKQLKGVKRAQVDNLPRLLLIGDYGWINQWLPGDRTLTEWHDKAEHHNLAFLDGHVEFLRIRKGFYVTNKYSILPFRSLYRLARSVQEPKPKPEPEPEEEP